MTGNKGWVVLAVVMTGTLVATWNVARHPNLSHVSFHTDSQELRQHAVTLRRQGGSSDMAGFVGREDAVAAVQKPQPQSPGANASASRQAAQTRKAGGAGADAAGASAKSAAARVGADAPKRSEKTASAPAPVALASAGGISVADAQAMLTQRVCGSPAVDGYAHVEPECLYKSPAAMWWKAWQAGGGRRQELVVHIERNADYDGLAVAWGIGNIKTSVEECAEACRAHQPNPGGAMFEPLPCNAFAFCPDDSCFEPDAHKHSKGDCWLKFTEGPVSPEVNFRGRIRPEMRARHPVAPEFVQWHAGVLLPPGVQPTNGSWGPRYEW